MNEFYYPEEEEQAKVPEESSSVGSNPSCEEEICFSSQEVLVHFVQQQQKSETYPTFSDPDKTENGWMVEDFTICISKSFQRCQKS